MLHRTSLPRPLLGLSLVLVGLSGAVRAHAPHDIAHPIAISPDFDEDGTIVAALTFTERKLFGRSVDGGRSWFTDEAGMALQGISDLEISPDFGRDRIVLCATNDGGVYRSTDGGIDWAPSNTGLVSESVRDLAVSPDFARDGTVLAATDLGLFRSVDGGASWAFANQGITEFDLRRVRFGAGGRAWAAGSNLHRSLDGGASWQMVEALPEPVASIAVSPLDPEGVALGFGTGGGGVWFSSDGGDSFTPGNDGLSDDQVLDVAFAGDGTLYCATRVAGPFRAAAPFAPWSLFTEGLEKASPLVSTHWYRVVPSPSFTRDDTVFLGAYEGFFTSTDRGTTWTQADTYVQRINRKLALSPTFAQDGSFFVGNYGGGVFRWGPGPGDAGPSRWSPRSTGMSGLYAGDLALSPDFARDQTLFHGYNSLWRSDDAGLAWTQLPLPESIEIVRGIGVSPAFADDQLVFVGGGGAQGVYRSETGGFAWTQVQGGLPNLSTGKIVFSPAFVADEHVYIANKNRQKHGVYRSTDGGHTWAGSGLVDRGVRSLAISPDFASDQILVAGTVGDGVWRSTTAGAGWKAINDGIAVGDEPIVVDSVAISPGFADDDTLFASVLSHGVYRSFDRGESWEAVNEGLPAETATRSVALSPDFTRDRTVVLTTHDWVFVSKNAGASWRRLPGLVRVDQRHQTVVHDGPWLQSEPTSEDYGGSTHASAKTGASSELTFLGDSVRWYARLAPDGGRAQVFVDGVERAVVDLFAPTEQPQQTMFLERFGVEGWHTIRVVVRGAGSASSAGGVVRDDGFAITFPSRPGDD